VKTSHTNQEAWVHFITLLTNKLFCYTHTKKKLPVFARVNSCSATHRNIEEASFSPSFIVLKAKMAGGATSEKREKENIQEKGEKKHWKRTLVWSSSWARAMAAI